jgi:opacity protein-like surface antigen
MQRLNTMGSILVGTVLAVSALLIFANPVSAADKGGPPPQFLDVPQAEMSSPWTGCWAGAKLSYTMQSTEVAGVSFDAKDAAIGPRVGCDFQLKSSSLVFGVMADADWTKAKSAVERLNFSWFVGVTPGLLLSDKTKAYGIVGYTSSDGSALTALPFSTDYRGLTLGAGMQTKLTKSWDLMAEWRRVDLGSDFGGLVDHHQHSVGLSLVYRFNQ